MNTAIDLLHMGGEASNTVKFKPKRRRVRGKVWFEHNGSMHSIELRDREVRVRRKHKHKYRSMNLDELVDWVLYGQRSLL